MIQQKTTIKRYYFGLTDYLDDEKKVYKWNDKFILKFK